MTAARLQVKSSSLAPCGCTLWVRQKSGRKPRSRSLTSQNRQRTGAFFLGPSLSVSCRGQAKGGQAVFIMVEQINWHQTLNGLQACLAVVMRCEFSEWHQKIAKQVFMQDEKTHTFKPQGSWITLYFMSLDFNSRNKGTCVKLAESQGCKYC